MSSRETLSGGLESDLPQLSRRLPVVTSLGVDALRAARTRSLASLITTGLTHSSSVKPSVRSPEKLAGVAAPTSEVTGA